MANREIIKRQKRQARIIAICRENRSNRAQVGRTGIYTLKHLVYGLKSTQDRISKVLLVYTYAI